MKAQAFLACATVTMVTALFGGVGCSTPAVTSGNQQPDKQDPPPAFDPGAVQTTAEHTAYPAGPYGVGKGSIIPNYAFIGYANAMKDITSMQNIEFGHFYNPHGRDAAYQPAAGEQDDRLYPPGSQYGEGQPKPTVLSVDVASVWCGPCNAEAQCVLPVHRRVYGACGGGLFLQLQDGATPGKAATPINLKIWATKTYKEDWPVAIDPQERLISSVATQQAFPVNILIDTVTMKIIENIAGVPDAKYWKLYESLLADPTCPSKQPKCATNADCADQVGTTCSTACPANAITCVPNSCQASGCKNQ